jgi:aryl-alcohol dehydrogenase-like predicted oxidoreductase
VLDTAKGGIEGLSAGVIERESARSLERLGVDTIDIYWAHGEDRSTSLEETVAAFGALVSSGAVRRLGVSNHPTWRVERARSIAARLGVEPYTALQLTTSYVDPRPGAQVPGKDHRFGFVTDETVDYLDLHPEMDLWVYSPLVQGSFDRADRPFPEAYDHPGTTQRLADLRRNAERLGVPASQVVLAWLLNKGWKPIVGVSSVEQLDSALAAPPLTADLLAVDSLP